MSNLNMQAFPDLSRMMLRRRQESNAVRSSREISPVRGDAIATFWKRLAERIQDEDDLFNMTRILRELQADIDLMGGLRQSLMMHRNGRSDAPKLQLVIRLLVMLLEIQDKLKYWHWVLRDRHLNFMMSINLAIPSKAIEKKESEKSEKKKGKAQAKKVLDLSKQDKKETKK
jgi:hypothetical protein